MEVGFKSLLEMYKAYMFPEIDAIIKKIEASEGMEAGEWVRQMVDPLHHKIMGRQAVGAPSKTREPVLVFADTAVYPIVIPSTFDPTLPWGIQIQTFPDTTAQEYNEYLKDNNLLSLIPAAQPRGYGGVIIIAFQNTNTCQWSQPASPNRVVLAQWSVQAGVVGVKHKTMVLMVKTENNTAPLYAGGARHAARHNEGNSERTTSYFIQNTVGGPTGVLQATEEFSYPLSTAQLSFLPGYMDGDAIDGSLNVCCADVWEEPALPDYTHTVFESLIPSAEPNTNNVIAPVVRTSTLDPAGAVCTYKNTSSGLKPMQQWFTGLTGQSTFTIRIDAITEAFYAPNVTGQLENNSLLRQATPYCPKAMNLVSLLLRNAPAMGVAADNKNFSWLKKVVADSRGDVSDILAMIPHPVAQGASMIWDAFKPQMRPALEVVGENDNQRQRNPPQTQLAALQNIHGPFAMANYKASNTRNTRLTNNSYARALVNNGPAPPPPSRSTKAYRLARRDVAIVQGAPNPYATTKTLKNRRKREKKKLKKAYSTA